jgi:hypothetical protein
MDHMTLMSTPEGRKVIKKIGQSPMVVLNFLVSSRLELPCEEEGENVNLFSPSEEERYGRRVGGREGRRKRGGSEEGEEEERRCVKIILLRGQLEWSRG